LSELNITPLLDLVFVLLVIFIITTPQLMNNLQLSLPSGKSRPLDVPKPDINTVTVDTDGRIKLNEQPMTLAQLRQSLMQVQTSAPESAFVIDGAADADYQKVVDVLDLFQQLQLKNVGLAAETVDEPQSKTP